MSIMERMIRETMEYCRQRKVFGQPLASHQVVQFRLAELQTEVEALRALNYRAAALMMSGEDVTLLVSMAKLKAGRLERKVADSCLQYWGGMGYAEEAPMARVFRDGRLLSIAGGADEYGGLGLDYSFTVAFAEELAVINGGGVTLGVMVHTDMCTPALTKYGFAFTSKFGSDELKRQFLAPSIAGDVVGCIGVSEPDCGSDVAAVQTTALRRGDDLVINGGKMWITNGAQADWMCLLANTRQEGPPHKTKSLICLPLKTPGGSPGEGGRGYCNGIPSTGVLLAGGMSIMERMIRETMEYCRQRKVFGQPLASHQVVQFRLAELQTEVEALRALNYRAAALMMSGEDVTLLVSMAKLKAGRLERKGGRLVPPEAPMARVFRDGRLLSIAGGADEVMLAIIAKMHFS
ncbi:hypothetical protein HPB48_020512 [Haemaphysalis longicornis]|uniref:Acyl-CoA dehydrogenase n=1 Tax=Haemaphysalis longicornis TaxID=44386 RepID=A0A9J6GTQ7_HAELO|nr:hypothetical protein HPB48_020512 [Haemaphysalis longicornis]